VTEHPVEMVQYASGQTTHSNLWSSTHKQLRAQQFISRTKLHRGIVTEGPGHLILEVVWKPCFLLNVIFIGSFRAQFKVLRDRTKSEVFVCNR